MKTPDITQAIIDKMLSKGPALFRTSSVNIGRTKNLHERTYDQFENLLNNGINPYTLFSEDEINEHFELYYGRLYLRPHQDIKGYIMQRLREQNSVIHYQNIDNDSTNFRFY